MRNGAGACLLFSVLPALDAGPAPKPVKDASALSPPPDSPAPGAAGIARLRWDPRLGRSEFRLDAKGLGGGTAFTLCIEGEAGSGDLEPAGPLDLPGASVRHRCRTDRGDPLPLGATSAAELAGRAIEVRDAAGRTCLSGTLPLLGGPGLRWESGVVPQVFTMLRVIREEVATPWPTR
jgi:hypothetical protein